MDGTCDWALSVCENRRKRKREDKTVNTNVENNSTSTINDLPDEILVDIISRLKLLKDAVSTSAVSRRWRYLWTLTCGSLEFEAWLYETDKAMKRRKLGAWVNHVLKLHNAPRVDSFIVRSRRSQFQDGDVDSWIWFAIRKEVKTFELDLEGRRRSRKYKLSAPKCSFVSLRSLKLAHVNVEDDMVHYLLASCPDLESLWIADSDCTKNIRVIAPNLKHLKLHWCMEIQRVEIICAASLLSFSYRGVKGVKYLLKRVPNLTGLDLWGDASLPFLYESNKHPSYCVHLTDLNLELTPTVLQPVRIAIPPDLPQLYSLEKLTVGSSSPVGRSLLFFTLLIKASPRLREFIITMDYLGGEYMSIRRRMPYPEMSAADVGTFNHPNLRSVQMRSYFGCSSEDELLLKLVEMAPSLEMVIIHTNWAHFKGDHKLHYPQKTKVARTRDEAKERAKNLIPNFPPHTQLRIT